MIYTTLNEIRGFGPCRDGWTQLLSHLGKTEADDEPLPLVTVLDSNGLNDAIWCLRVCPDVAAKFARWCADREAAAAGTTAAADWAADWASAWAANTAALADMSDLAASIAASSSAGYAVEAAKAAYKAAGFASSGAARAAGYASYGPARSAGAAERRAQADKLRELLS